ncbi:uncharacterized protein LOC123557931 [Mercenaria mercenaria]|uniref:uncharacterized protein LOC123557931 n=1 Tax=Mercenaria mercenaria TaxID=6596 RepID=UPI00234F5781|nr:uncharacterized protein LOC123557931 [Mercenaria mercenaria]
MGVARRSEKYYKYSPMGLKGVFKYAVIVFACLLVTILYSNFGGKSFSSKSMSQSKYYITRSNSTYYQKFSSSKITINSNTTVENSFEELFVQPDFIPADNTKRKTFFKCNETFNKTLKENLDVIKNYPRGNAAEYLLKLGVDKTGPDKLRTFPVFATALTSIQVWKSVHILCLFWACSLQYSKVKKNCRCEIRRFPFEKFPPHVFELKTYAFKPIIVQMLLMEFGFVWWMDSSLRFMTSNIDPALDYAKKYGILHTVSTDNRNSCGMTKHTDTRTFEFLHEDRCKFRPFGEIWATTAMFHFDRVSRVAVEAWATCALNKNCIAPTGSDKKLTCDYKKDYDGRCHRFDQSVLGIITRRIFHEQNRYPLDYSLNDIYKIHRGNFVPYFL